MEEKAYVLFCYQTLFYLFIKNLIRNYFCKLGKSIAKYMKTKIKYLLCLKYFTVYKKCKYNEIIYSGKILIICYMQINLNTLFRGYSTFYHSNFRVPLFEEFIQKLI